MVEFQDFKAITGLVLEVSLRLGKRLVNPYIILKMGILFWEENGLIRYPFESFVGAQGTSLERVGRYAILHFFHSRRLFFPSKNCSISGFGAATAKL